MDAYLLDWANLLLRWVHVYPGLAEKMPPGCRLKVSGKVRQGYGMLEIVHPTIKIIPEWEWHTHASESDSNSYSNSGSINEPTPRAYSSSKQSLHSNEAAQPVYPSTGDIKQAIARYVQDVKQGRFPGPEHSF